MLKKRFSFLSAIAAAVLSSPQRPQKRSVAEIINSDTKPKERPLPPGVQKYSFDDGNFTCIARNMKNAERKYQNWENKTK